MKVKHFLNPNLKPISFWKILQLMVEKTVSLLTVISDGDISESSFVVISSHSSKQPELLSSFNWQATTSENFLTFFNEQEICS